jgi:hypothetical protein
MTSLAPFGDLDQRVEVDSRLEALAVQEVHEIFRGDVSRCVGREGTAAKTADGGVEHGGSGGDGGGRVRVTRITGVMEVPSHGDAVCGCT